MIIGDRLRALREERKFSQGDVEKRTGLLRCYISRVENGHAVPAIETLEKWPAHLRSLSINSSTMARNRLSCPISRNARLRARMPGAAPAKTPVFWSSSADCWVAWTRATKSCCWTSLKRWPDASNHLSGRGRYLFAPLSLARESSLFCLVPVYSCFERQPLPGA